ncbi:MAG: AraC family transcriptional regulator [Taibaiella sp.]|nr:AraC family transcriptional regulator [Taibaiella sp.]
MQWNINKIIRLASSDHPHKQVLSKLATQELIINLMQTHARSQLMLSALQMSAHNPLAYAIQYIRDHIFEKLDIGKIAGKAFMSKATFFRHFKMETGVTPGDFILREKINQAKKLLRQQHRTIADIAYTLSFNSASHFIQLFKKFTGSTPNKFRSEADTGS